MTTIKDYFNTEKYNKVKDNQFFIEELKLIDGYKQVEQYYRHIICNIDINRNNPNNSYVMWVCNKVDSIDTNRPANITNGHVSLPDIDMDFAPSFRQNIIDYLHEKYGKDNVAQMVTFSRVQGRSAIKDVLRAFEACSFEEMNEITQFIPNEQSIADELKDCDHNSTILWALENNAEGLKRWVYLDDGVVKGPMSKFFDIAIKIENTYRHTSKHAGGVIISPIPIDEVCPLIYDKSLGDRIVGVDMNDAEFLGLVKVDILGVSTLDKIEIVKQLLELGEIVKD